MKIKIFTTSAWNTSSIEADVNRWLEKNPDYSVVDIKMAGTEDRVICTVMYNDNEKTAEEESREAVDKITAESDGSFADFIKSAAAYVDAARTAYDAVAKKCSCMTCKYRLIDTDICPLTKERIGNKICFNYERS